jgi:lysophospholipase L1-like esterase
MVLALFVFPLLNEMYFRGTQSKIISPDYNKQNFFYEINENGFRGPTVPIERSKTPRLLFLGDSTAFGWPYRYEESFPFIVKSILKALGSDVEIVNAASVGQSIGQIRQQLPYFLEYKPDLVLLMTGVHYHRADKDFQRILEDGVSRDTQWRPFIVLPPMLIEIFIFSLTTSPVFSTKKEGKVSTPELESFKVHLRAVVQQIRDSGARLYLVDYPTPGAERRVQDEIRRVAQETGTDYIPLFELLNSEHLRHDPIHPNREGHRLIAEEIARVVFDDLVRIPPPQRFKTSELKIIK